MDRAPHKAAPRTRSTVAFGSAVVLACVALVLGWRALWFLTDDAFIHFRYVGNSVLGHGYVWNPPPFRPVEGYTSFLWVALLDGVWRVAGVLPPDSANVLSLAFALLTLLLTAWCVATMPLSERLDRHRFWLLVLVLAGLVGNRTFVTWTSSGLETALVNFLVLAWLVAALRLATAPSTSRAALLSVAAALLHLARPEGLVFAAATLGALALWAAVRARETGSRAPGSPEPGRLRALALASAPLLVIPAHLAWRLSFYGEWLPNTYYAKHVAPWPVAGYHYALSYTLEHATWIWLGVVALFGPGLLARRLVDTARAARERGWRSKRVVSAATRALAVLTVAFVAFYYTFVIGGDAFEYRLYSHAVPLLLLSLVWLLDARGSGPRATLGTLAASVVLACPLAWMHWSAARAIPAEQAAEDVSVPIADRLPGVFRWYGRLFDAEQAWLVEHLLCGRHHSHVYFTNELLALYPERDLGATLALDDIPVMERDAIGVAGWTLPHIAIVDLHGLTDYVAARTPVPPGQKRQMAHDRMAPPEYLAEFRLNVAFNRKGVVRIKRRPDGPLTAADVVAIEDRWWRRVAEPSARRAPTATPRTPAKTSGAIRNVVLVSIDTLRADHLQAYGYDRPTSPFLLELAQRGVVFEQAIAQAPWTLPSHAALLNGAHPSSLGEGPWERRDRIPPEAVSIAEVLQQHGWRTHAVVNGGFLSKTFGLDQGFEQYLEHDKQTATTVNRGLRWLSREPGADEPFFLFLHTYEVHEYSPPAETAELLVRPYDGFVSELGDRTATFVQDRELDTEGIFPALDDADRRYLVDLYDAALLAVDRELERLWSGLEERGLTESTLLVITSDHGEEFFEHSGSGHGYTLHDENVRVPLILVHPSLTPRRVRDQVRLIDLAPTLAALLGVAASPTWEGTDLTRALAGEALELPAISEQAHVPFVALRSGALKLIRGADSKLQLYDLDADPLERRDLGGSGHPREAELRDALERWVRDHDAWPPPLSGDVDLEQDLLERLKSLGYLGDG